MLKKPSSSWLAKQLNVKKRCNNNLTPISKLSAHKSVKRINSNLSVTLKNKMVKRKADAVDRESNFARLKLE